MPNSEEYREIQGRDELSAAAQAISDELPTKKMKGGKFVCYYVNGWGGSGRKPKKSHGFHSKAALAAALADWCLEGDPWHQRIKMA